MSSQYGELPPTNGWDRLTSLGHPCKFQLVSRLGSITARHLVMGVSQTAALNRGRHLYSVGRPWHWALAHISSTESYVTICSLYASMQRGCSTEQHVEKRRRLQVRFQQHPTSLSSETLSTSSWHLRKHGSLKVFAVVIVGISRSRCFVSNYRCVLLLQNSLYACLFRPHLSV